VDVHHGAVIAARAFMTRVWVPCMIVRAFPPPRRARVSPDLAERMITRAWRDRDHMRLPAAPEDVRALPCATLLAKHGG
jgi:hypothetical protein